MKRQPLLPEVVRFSSITVSGVAELDQLDIEPFTHIISIWAPWDGKLEIYQRFRRRVARHPSCLFSYFDDVKFPTVEKSEATLGHLREMLAFSSALDESSSLLVHCWAGRSRSAAVAYSIFCQAAGPGAEQECLGRLCTVRPQANPNSLVVSLADQLLERNGKMVAANQAYLESRKSLREADESKRSFP